MADKLLDALQSAGARLALDVDGGSVSAPLRARRFSTGSAGFHWQGKVEGSAGRRYQVNVTVTLIGSRPGTE